MNDMHEMWSSPWHALLKSVAGGSGAQGVAHGTIPSSVMAQRGAAGCADSWLNRARCRGAALPAL